MLNKVKFILGRVMCSLGLHDMSFTGFLHQNKLDNNYGVACEKQCLRKVCNHWDYT